MIEGFQRDRIYSLIVGTAEDAVEINNLQIKFDVVKTKSNKDKKNTAKVEIYNLSEERRKKLEQDFIQVSLKVGYAHTGLSTLFTGQVVNVSNAKVKPFLSKKSGADIITTLEITELYEELNGTQVSKLVPAGKTVGDAIREVVKAMPSIGSVQMNGRGINTPLPDGYPLSGNPVHILDRISSDYHIDWQIDNKTLLISDVDGSFENKDKTLVPKIGQMSGLIESPEYVNEEAKRLRREVAGKTKKYKNPKENSLKIKILLNPTIVAGSVFKLEFGEITGFYIVSEVRHKGGYRDNDWYSEILATQKID